MFSRLREGGGGGGLHHKIHSLILKKLSYRIASQQVALLGTVKINFPIIRTRTKQVSVLQIKQTRQPFGLKQGVKGSFRHGTLTGQTCIYMNQLFPAIGIYIVKKLTTGENATPRTYPS